MPEDSPLSLQNKVWYGVPTMTVRMRHTRSHTRNRRSHHALTDGALVTDKESGALRLPHRIDETTGMYRGKQIAAPKAVAPTKKEKRVLRAEMAAALAAAQEQAGATPAPENKPETVAKAKEAKKEVKKGSVLEKVTKARTNTRSGMGGGA